MVRTLDSSDKLKVVHHTDFTLLSSVYVLSNLEIISYIIFFFNIVIFLSNNRYQIYSKLNAGGLNHQKLLIAKQQKKNLFQLYFQY